MLIERAGFLTSLEGLLGEALDGSGRLVFLGGEAGIGKTTLAAALADAAAGPEVRRGPPAWARTARPPSSSSWRCATTSRRTGSGPACSSSCHTSAT